MRDEDLQRYRKKLLETLERVAAEHNQLTDELSDALRIAGDRANAPTHNADHDVEGLVEIGAMLERTGAQIFRSIDAALKRMDQGTFGVCQECSKNIPKERLNAIPYAAYCVKCEQQREEAGLTETPE